MILQYEKFVQSWDGRTSKKAGGVGLAEGRNKAGGKSLRTMSGLGPVWF